MSDPLATSLFLAGAFVALAILAPQKPGGRDSTGLALLRRVSSMVNRSLDLPTIISTSLDEVMHLFGMDAGAFRLAGGGEAGTHACVHRGFSAETVAIIEQEDYDAPAVEQLARKNLLNAANLDRWPGSGTMARALAGEGMHFFALYPIRSGNRTLGFLALASRDARPVRDSQEFLIHALTEILGVALVNVELREQAGKFAEDLVALQEVNKIISQSFHLEDIIRRIVVEGKRLVKTDHCHLFLLDESQRALVGTASTQSQDLDVRTVRIDLTEVNAATSALLERRVIAVQDTQEGRASRGTLAHPPQWRSAICAPLLTKEQALGVLICSDTSRPRTFTPEEMSRAETLAHQAALALESARLFQVVSRSQKEWETTFDAMQDCVSVHDMSGKVVRANLALARRLKTKPPKVIGRYCSDLYRKPGAGPGTCPHTASLRPHGQIVEELELPNMEGTFQISVVPWYDKNNRLAGAVHVAKDITNETLLRQQLIQSEKLSAIGELISGIAHELNNPLTGVMGYSQLLQLREDLDDNTRGSLHKINNLALRCQRIVQNLLSFARKQIPERKLCDINEILERTIELRSYELQVNNIAIEVHLQPDLPRTIADGHQLQQVFLNVVTNAEHAMLESKGHGALTLRTRADQARGNIVIEIVDDGPGIPEAHLTKIFDPFFTTKEVGKGTGLGLSLSYGIVKEHGGDIYAVSRTGKGATFVIELPIITCLDEESTLPDELMPQALRFENLVRGKKILIVDDEKYILDFFIEVFRYYPALEVETADNGREAREKMERSDYDVVVTDYKMPQMGGRELFHWIKKERPHMTGRIVFVTGDTVSMETRSFLEKNGNRYLAKPFKIEEIKEVIQQTLEQEAAV